MPIAAIFAEEAAAALAAELAPYAAGEAALAAGTVLGAEALMGLGAEALGTSAIGGAEAALTADAMAANAAAGGAGAGQAGINAAQVAAQQNAAVQAANAANAGITAVPQAAPQAANYFTQGVPQLPSSPLSQYNLSAPPAGGEGFRLGANAGAEGLRAVPSTANALYSGYQPSALEAGMDKAIKFAEKNPFTAMTGAYMGASALGLLNPSGATFNDKPYDGPLSRYRLASDFQGRTANPLDFQYKPRYAEGGGIMGAGAYDIPVGYDEGGPVALPLPSRTMRDADVFQTPGAGYNPAQQPAADAYNDIIRSRVINDTASGRLTDANRGYYQATPDQLTTMAQGRGAFTPGFARDELGARSTAGEFAVPGYGDLGQFAGSSNSLKDDNPYNVDAYAKGGSLSESISEYQRMLSGQTPAAPAASRDVGIYYDQDPDTRYQDALTAAQIRQAKVNQRAYVSPPAAKRPTPMGKLNMPTSAKSKGGDDVEAASGGIMHSSLGGYAAGGNPRLLKGPGDGMSDNIPATINGRQPARLADGEFVVPADVVSHLGNGSTDAGAKQLHAMMDKVRKARTGNPKQGKQINAKKYLPK